MNTYDYAPTFRKAPTASISTLPTVNNSLIGLSAAEVAQECQWDIMQVSRGQDREATGDTFLNVLLPRLFVFDLEGKNPLPAQGIYANFNNLMDSPAIFLANALSIEFLKTGNIPDKQYFFKLIDSKTKLTIATDMPEYEREESESNLPSYLQPTMKAAYTPDPKVCAFFHVYAEVDGRPVRIASQNIESRYEPQVNVIAKVAKAGHHIQAGMDVQSKVRAWDQDRKNKALAKRVEQAMNLEDFSAVAEG